MMSEVEKEPMDEPMDEEEDEEPAARPTTPEEQEARCHQKFLKDADKWAGKTETYIDRRSKIIYGRSGSSQQGRVLGAFTNSHWNRRRR